MTSNPNKTQVPGEVAQYNGWTGERLLELVAYQQRLISSLQTENELLKTNIAYLVDEQRKVAG